MLDQDGAPIREGTSYNVWEVGKPPDFALEVASPSTYRDDIYEKPGIYARIGIPEYWMFDPTGGEYYGEALRGYRLVDGQYEPIEILANDDGLPSGYSEVLGLNLCCSDKSKWDELTRRQPSLVFTDEYHPYQLLFQDPVSGRYLLNLEGWRTEHRLAEEAKRQAEAERDAAQSEIARLREQIRRMKEN